MAERVLMDAAAAGGEQSLALLRYFNPIGAHASGRIGDDPLGPAQNLMPCLERVAVGSALALTVHGTDYPTRDGTGIRDYIHVSDLADAHVAALEWLVEHPGVNLVMNCGYGTGLSVLEVLDAVDRHTNRPVKRVMEGRRAGDPPELVAANARLLATLAWRPKYADIDRIVADALAWERKLLELNAASADR